MVINGILRVRLGEGERIELGPCTMLYLPAGVIIQLEAPWSPVTLRIFESYDMGVEPRILNHTYAIKTPSGEAALCIQVGEEGVRIHLPSIAYPVKGKILALDGNTTRIVKPGEKLEPPVTVKPLEGRRAALLIITGR